MPRHVESSGSPSRPIRLWISLPSKVKGIASQKTLTQASKWRDKLTRHGGARHEGFQPWETYPDGETCCQSGKVALRAHTTGCREPSLCGVFSQKSQVNKRQRHVRFDFGAELHFKFRILGYDSSAAAWNRFAGDHSRIENRKVQYVLK